MSGQKSHFYIDSLDGIRALAVLLVFFGHSGFGDMVPAGFGVTVFFFLSGYLISTLLRIEFEKTGRINIRDFYIRRVYRIFPPFYIALITGLILTWLYHSPLDFNVMTVIFQALHLTNYYQILVGYNVVPDTSLFWSLAVEEHYYLFFPIVLLCLLKQQSYSKIALLFLFCCLMVLMWRYYLVLYLGVPARHTNLATDTRIDSILFGCILGLWMNPVLDRLPAVGVYHQVFLFCISLMVLMGTFLYRDPVFRETLRYSLQGMALLPLFYLAIARSDWPVFRLLNWKWVRVIGQVSFTFYLFHMMAIHVAFNWMHAYGVESRWVAILLGFMITLCISFAMYYLVESRFVKMRKKLAHVNSIRDQESVTRPKNG